jgi:2'-5' RNA ligase
MPNAITLRLDDDAAACVQRVLDALDSRGIVGSVRRLGYQPHVTLAVWEQDAEPEDARALIAGWRELAIDCPALGVFPGTPATLFLAVTPTAALLQRQAALARLLPGHRVHPHYRPGAWVPHATLADSLDPAAAQQAWSVALAAFRPFAAKLLRADRVRFPPVQVLWSADLSRA